MSEQKRPPDIWVAGTEVVSMYNFRGSSQEDLPFRRGEVLKIVKATKDPMWYFARHPEGREGMIPSNYVHKRGEVKLHAMPWFHGKMSRTEAETKLSPMNEGLFLVRESNNYPGDYTLCVCAEHKVEHYHILYRNNKLTIDDEVSFENLTQLVEHYEKDADGLCTRLVKPVEKQGSLDYSVDQKTFEEQGWVIKPKDIKIGDFIGGGDFANVYKAEYVPNKSQVAAKVLKDATRASQLFLAEASVMTALRHPNLVNLIGVVTSGPQKQIITEFMAKGSLVEYLRTRGRSVITKEDQINFASDTCRGMAYLESKNLVHRDLAARNVLINEDGIAKVSDFGLARPKDANHDGGRFPIKWTSPEALRESKFTSKSDMWSFAILLWEVYTFGRVPYPRIPLADVVSHIERGYRMERPDGCPEEVYKIMEKAWSLKPAERPTFDTVMHQLDHMRATTV